ncbi:hypothetical protein Tco_1003098 [Tanacetum coccineum]|uniref:Uncharacterized protein n=1 Tax=Tanacetum coccineum TaxID=301880 RepID=A0ABQ5F9G1_9ASTR
MNPLFSNNHHERTYHEQPEIINSTIGDDQITSNIIFDDPNVELNDGSVEHDKNAHGSYDNELEQLARNAYKEAEKQQILAQKNLKLYDASYLHSSTVHLNVCDTEKIREDATKSQIKMGKKLKDPIAIEKKQNFRPIDYGKLNNLYETFVPQVELSLEQKYFSSASITFENSTSASISSSPPVTMPSSKVTTILDYLHMVFKAIQTEFLEEVKAMMDVFESMESDLDATWKQNEILNDQLLEATLKHDVEKCVLMCSDSMNNDLNNEIEKVKRESIDVQKNLLK